MKRFILTLLALAIVLGALYVALKPVAVEQIHLWHGAEAVSAYRKTAKALDTLDCGTRLNRAREYNSAPDKDSGQAAREALDLNGDGVIAVLSVPKLGEAVPVYFDDTPDTRQKGVSLVKAASLPVGGAGTYCELYGPRTERLAGLDRLMPGDCFYIEAIQDTLVYEVEQILTVTGESLENGVQDAEADVCALVTEAAGEDEAERLYVRARRVNRRMAPLADDSLPLPDWAARGILALPVLLAGLIVLVLMEALRRGARRRRIKHTKI